MSLGETYFKIKGKYPTRTGWNVGVEIVQSRRFGRYVLVAASILTDEDGDTPTLMLTRDISSTEEGKTQAVRMIEKIVRLLGITLEGELTWEVEE